MMLTRSFRFWLAAAASLFPLLAGGQTLNISEGIHTYPGLTNTTVTMTGRCELRITATNNPIPGCVVHLNSPDAWFVLPNIRPSVAASYLSQIRVNGANAVSGANVRVDEFAMGTVVVPHAPSLRPVQVFNGLNFLGASTNFGIYIYHTNAALGPFDRAIRSFKLKRGYMATFAQRDDGGGASQVFVAQDGDLEVGVLATNLDRSVRLIRVFPWRWTSKKGWAGGVQPLVRPHWSYDWDNVTTSTLDAEYVPMRHNLNWNAYANIIDPLPSLNIVASPGALVLSWPAAASYFALYSATNLTAPIAWRPVATDLELLNGSWTVSISPPITGNKFFRLQIP